MPKGNPRRCWCDCCQREFMDGGTGPKARWCSDRCRSWWRSQGDPALHRRVKALRRVRVCPWCGESFRGSTRQAQQVYCSKDCGGFARGEMATGARMCKVPWRVCTDCGAHFVGYHQRQTPLCNPCRVNRRQALNRRKNVKRRGADVGASYTLDEIGDRDGWVCHLCRRKVRRDIPRTDPQGPTIDHLIPVSAGGNDEPVNVKLAHLSCNCSRRDGGEVQLLLVG